MPGGLVVLRARVDMPANLGAAAVLAEGAVDDQAQGLHQRTQRHVSEIQLRHLASPTFEVAAKRYRAGRAGRPDGLGACESGRVIEAVVFDLDGVLIDSEPVWEEVRRGLVAAHGGHWAPDAQRRLMGMSTQEWARYLSQDLGAGLPPEEVAAQVIRQMAARYARDLPLMPGAVAAVRRMAARWPLGLASSSPPVLIQAVLAAASIAPLFAATVSTEEVAHGKPAPDVYLTVAERLGVPPAHAVAVEDSSNGLRSAAAAGLQVIAVPHPRYPPDPDALALARLVLPSLAGLTADAVAGLAAPRLRADFPAHTARNSARSGGRCGACRRSGGGAVRARSGGGRAVRRLLPGRACGSRAGRSSGSRPPRPAPRGWRGPCPASPGPGSTAR